MADLDNPFSFLPPTEEQRTQIEVERTHFEWLHDRLVHDLPPSRYRSLALTALEECGSWVNKAIVRG